MKVVEASFGNWYVQCIPEDGARISVLKYEGQDLLTANPPSFCVPEKFYGEYETRPVYGYDDCFPTVDPCIYPDESFECRDHGELCWLRWQVRIEENNLICSVDCLQPKVTFRRILKFDENKLSWCFELENTSNKDLVFLHVMHALLPLNQVQSIGLPGFSNCFDDLHSMETFLKNAPQVARHLLEVQPGGYEMLLLKDIESGSVELGLQDNVNLHISFDNKLFPTLGIWWNNAAYPDEEGLKRTECAFEPIPGTSSNLLHSSDDGVCLSVGAGESMDWEITWEVKTI